MEFGISNIFQRWLYSKQSYRTKPCFTKFSVMLEFSKSSDKRYIRIMKFQNNSAEWWRQSTHMPAAQQWFTSVSHTRSWLCYFLLWDRKWRSHPGRGGKWVRDRGRLFIFYPKTSQLPVWDTDVNRCCEYHPLIECSEVQTFHSPVVTNWFY